MEAFLDIKPLDNLLSLQDEVSLESLIDSSEKQEEVEKDIDNLIPGNEVSFSKFFYKYSTSFTAGKHPEETEDVYNERKKMLKETFHHKSANNIQKLKFYFSPWILALTARSTTDLIKYVDNEFSLGDELDNQEAEKAERLETGIEDEFLESMRKLEMERLYKMEDDGIPLSSSENEISTPMSEENVTIKLSSFVLKTPDEVIISLRNLFDNLIDKNIGIVIDKDLDLIILKDLEKKELTTVVKSDLNKEVKKVVKNKNPNKKVMEQINQKIAKETNISSDEYDNILPPLKAPKDTVEFKDVRGIIVKVNGVVSDFNRGAMCIYINRRNRSISLDEFIRSFRKLNDLNDTDSVSVEIPE